MYGNMARPSIKYHLVIAINDTNENRTFSRHAGSFERSPGTESVTSQRQNKDDRWLLSLGCTRIPSGRQEPWTTFECKLHVIKNMLKNAQVLAWCTE